MRFRRRRADRLTHGVTAKVIKLEIRNWLLALGSWLLAIGYWLGILVFLVVLVALEALELLDSNL